MNVLLLRSKFTWSALDSRVKRVSSAARLTDDIVCLKNGQTRGTRIVNDCCMLEWTRQCMNIRNPKIVIYKRNKMKKELNTIIITRLHLLLSLKSQC